MIAFLTSGYADPMEVTALAHEPLEIVDVRLIFAGLVATNVPLDPQIIPDGALAQLGE